MAIAGQGVGETTMDPDAFCREIEAHLCRKNDGHLVRVVGPAFLIVSDWAARGVPLKVAFRGIDRYFERYYAKGPRRRPVRIEFCEADVLDAFDEWRRAVGIGMSGGERTSPGDVPGEGATPHKHGHSLRAHLDRVVTRLTALQAAGLGAAALESAVERAIERLSSERDRCRTLRGEARQASVSRLDQLDADLMEAARRATTPDAMAALRAEAEDELAGFRARMTHETFDAALRAATTRLLRERWKLPVISYGSGI